MRCRSRSCLGASICKRRPSELSSPQIRFDLGSAGWAELAVLDGTKSHVIRRISYLSDALDDLLRVGIDIATDRGYGFAQFFHEPGSTILFAETGWWEGQNWIRGARLSSVEGEEYGGAEPTWRGLHDAQREFVVQFPSRDGLALAILETGRQVLDCWGIQGYSERWTGRLGFPSRGLACLQSALSTVAEPEKDYT